MAMLITSSPHTTPGNTVSRVMLQVLLALLPGIVALVWWFGPGVIINILLACTTAVTVEAIIVSLRHRPVSATLLDGSAIVTAVLLAVALPPLAPWWLTVLGTAFGMVFGKHLFGGLGQNPFNPAMLGYVVLLISFPLEMSTWLSPRDIAATPDLSGALQAIFASHHGPDALSGATPLDTLRTGLSRNLSLEELQAQPLFHGMLAAQGWEWVSLAWLAGGLWLIWRRIIHWQIPVAMLLAIAVLAMLFHVIDPARYSSPLLHLLGGASMLGAFFIATDPVTASTTPRGRLLFGAGIGILVYVIRSWGGYPDGVAFAVLLMNMCTPVIDYYTQPRVLGGNRK